MRKQDAKEIIEHNFPAVKKLLRRKSTIIKKTMTLNDDTLQSSVESVEKTIFSRNLAGQRKIKNKTFFLNLSEIDDLDKIEYYRGYQLLYQSAQKDTGLGKPLLPHQ